MLVIFFTYCLVFANGKIYVGMSRTDRKGLFTARYNNHARDVKKGRQSPVYRAWRKHGAPFQYVLTQHETREECAASEIALIDLFDARNPEIGYNLVPGGGGMHAPKGSPIYELMMEKVWMNPERRAKCSVALKGRSVSPETIEGFRNWAETEGPQMLRERMAKRWGQPGAREHQAQKTREQMTPEAREHLRKIHTGRPDPRSEEGKQRQREKVKAYLATPEGKASARRGYAAFVANPDNLAARDQALGEWRASDANRENCKRIAQLSAEKCKRPVEDLKTGVVYPSQRDMAVALGISDGAVSLRVKKGTARRL